MKKTAIILIFIVFALSGCGASSSINYTLEPTMPLSKFKTMTVNVQSKTDNPADELVLFKANIMSALEKNGRWQVLPDGSKGDTLLNVTITDYDRVSKTKRALMGMHAGRATIYADVELKDSTGAVITRFSISGKSTNRPIDTLFYEAMYLTAEKIAETLK